MLTSDSAEKVYGTAVTFYEKFSDQTLSEQELQHLTFCTEEDKQTKSLHRIKSICILSRWPFFDTFEKFLLFLHKTYVLSATTPQKIPLERYISHFMLEIPFPLPNRPKILVQLGVNTEETVLISQPPEYMPLALTGASFTQMLRNLGPENCLHVLLFALTEQKILLHSLRPDVLTSVAEAVVTMIFPFHWQCPYIPMCPIGLSDVLNAPLPFLVGVDSRYFDHFEPPIDVASIDLDTNSIYLSENKRLLNPKLMPKKPTRTLKNTLEKLFERLIRPMAVTNGNSTQKSKNNVFTDSLRNRKNERIIELEIQEAFIRFMASILRSFRLYLLPITRAPTVGATDPSSLFDIQGFLKSRDKTYHKFYSLLMKTQMFTRFIEERSFVSDKNISLAFFDECSEKLEAMGDYVDSSPSLRLLDFGDYIHSDQTAFIPPPEPINPEDEFSYQEFGPLEPNLFHKNPTFATLSRIGSIFNESEIGLSENSSIAPSSPISKRTKQEIRTAHKVARKHSESPMSWAKCLLSYSYSLWFIHLPAFVRANASQKPKPMSVAFEVLLRMQSLRFHPSDEVCYRVMMLLCGIYSEPVLAVKVLFEMKANNVTPNAITYGYYNKAVLESKWPTGDTTATLMWNKLRNVIAGVAQFRHNSRIRSSQMNQNLPETEIPVKTDSIRSSGPSDCGYATTSESFSSETIPTFNRIVKELKESDSFRERTRSIVRKSTSNLNCVHDFDSAAGLLMTTDMSKFSAKYDCDQSFIKRRHKSAEIQVNQNKDSKMNLESNLISSLSPSSPKPYLRSYSFGNDAQIIQKLKSGPLIELRQQLQQNVPRFKKPFTDNENDSNKNEFYNKTIGGLSRCAEDPEEDIDEIDGEKQVLQEWHKNLNECIVSDKSEDDKIDETSNYKSSDLSLASKTTNKSSETTETNSNKSTEKVNEIPKNAFKNSEVISSFSPLKEAIMNMELFNPDGKVASTLRSSFRMASRFTKSSTPVKPSMTRSSTFHESNHSTSEKALNKIGSLFRRDSQKSSTDSGTPLKSLSRSATLPQVSPSHRIDENTEQKENELPKSESIENKLTESQEELTIEGQNSRDNSLLNLSSQWTNKLAANKHSEYVYSTIKSAANNVANRFSGLKSSLAQSTSSASNSPSKLMNTSNTSAVMTGMATGTANLISQWASIVADKFPSNFMLEDDDCSSNNSFDMRRNSFASEDDMSERSREGSLGRNFAGFGINSNTSPLFDTLEKHYSSQLEPTLSSTKVVLEIVMTSCSRCYTCYALLYDEEIMEGWTPDDSNLNTNCSFCSSKFVPLLTIKIKVSFYFI